MYPECCMHALLAEYVRRLLLLLLLALEEDKDDTVAKSSEGGVSYSDASRPSRLSVEASVTSSPVGPDDSTNTPPVPSPTKPAP
jgi:hypothetical protein